MYSGTYQLRLLDGCVFLWLPVHDIIILSLSLLGPNFLSLSSLIQVSCDFGAPMRMGRIIWGPNLTLFWCPLAGLGSELGLEPRPRPKLGLGLGVKARDRAKARARARARYKA